MFKENFLCDVYIPEWIPELILDGKCNKICFGVVHKIFQHHKQNLSTAGYRSVKRNGL